MNTYSQFHVTLPEEFVPAFEEMTADYVMSIWWDPTGNVTGLMLLEKSAEMKEVLKFLSEQYGFVEPEILFGESDNKDWLEEDQRRLLPVEVGRFFLHPPHYDKEVPKGKIVFKIDSPYAFGSGHHETTETCLKVLQGLPVSFSPKKALDIGCGSGVLAMAITTLWNTPVFATDCDPICVVTAKENFSLNSVRGVVLVECDSLNHETISHEAPYDLIVANIHSDILITLSSSVEKVLSQKGWLILSGILEEQKESVIRAYEERGIQVQESHLKGDWVTLLLKVL